MKDKQKARLETRAAILKALAHPSRLFIVDQLAKNPSDVTKLTKMIGANMSTVSKHLSILKGAGLILDEKRGKQVLYHLKTKNTSKFLVFIDAFLEEQAKERLAIIKG